MKNIYQPDLMEVAAVQRHTADVKSVKVRFRDASCAEQFQFRVGQFGIFSAFGYGESVFNICSSSTWSDGLEFCFRKTGRVTEALWEVEEGDTIGFRGPYGNGYPVEAWKGKNLIFLGGGIAMPPIRCAIWYALENRADYGDITIVYGARTVADLVYVDG
jgi:sulfhydrogenase subunit gamma (sulfur reductase)